MSTTWAAANDPQPAMAHLGHRQRLVARQQPLSALPPPFLTERRSYAPRAPERGRGSESRRTTARSGRRAFVDAVEVSRKKKKKKQQRLSQQPVFSTGPVVGRSRTGRNKTRPTQPASQTDRQTDTALPIEAELLFSSPSLSQAPLQDALGLSVTHYSFINVRSFLLSSVIR
ncbi:hypothetical protein DTO166G4_5218 [Paecilomyces variotii]|nr:hypothetical protein DTO166G4_5218 [Paecilomyces variotii]KAJ9227961.1 hypothetical protein DTO166G5_8984 [Paecilomyces variotii]KAJ9259651.1 hypothetical protein DTO195F2_4772 [Paecilomyces variotii]KAJ9370858.1 hypothetical protein DTO282E5_4387 [Paecilomyces variotii]